MAIHYTKPKHEGRFGGWSRTVEVNGTEYQCSIQRGKRVRIPYKPRGENTGFKWWGSVYCNDKQILSCKAHKSTGCRGLLKAARIVE